MTVRLSVSIVGTHLPRRKRPSGARRVAGIRTGGHIIFGLPGEKREELVGQAALVSVYL